MINQFHFHFYWNKTYINGCLYVSDSCTTRYDEYILEPPCEEDEYNNVLFCEEIDVDKELNSFEGDCC